MVGMRLAWLIVALLAYAVAGYALVLLVEPTLRPPFVRALYARHPVAAAAHFSGSALALAAGIFQISSWLRTRAIALHRWLGRAYVLGVGVGGLAGFFLGLHASGGPVARTGFTLLAVCWLGFTAFAYYHVRVRHLDAHRRWMIRSFALTLGAVTLRIYLPASLIADVSFAVAYPIIAWMAWVPNLMVAELFIRRRGRRTVRTAI